MRDVGSYGDDGRRRRARRCGYGAFRGPRLLTCGRIVSATAPGGRFFAGMYREADGCGRRAPGRAGAAAARRRLRQGDDDRRPLGRARGSRPRAAHRAREIATLVEEAHRIGYRVAAHAEGIAGTELAIDGRASTRSSTGCTSTSVPTCSTRMAETGQVARADAVVLLRRRRPRRARRRARRPDVDRRCSSSSREYNLEQADLTLQAAHAAGVPIALGHDWNAVRRAARSRSCGWSTTACPRARGAVAATATGGRRARARRRTSGRSSRASSPTSSSSTAIRSPTRGCCADRERIWLVLQLGEPVAGAALERSWVDA